MRAATTRRNFIERSGKRGTSGKRANARASCRQLEERREDLTPNAPERISPKHGAILVTRAADQMTEAQQHLFDRISGQCPDVIDLRQMALAFRTALTGGDAAKLRALGRGRQAVRVWPRGSFRLRIEKGPLGGLAAVKSP